VRPLAVDLDGTLLRTDSLHELTLSFLRMRWMNVFVLIGLLFRDRATLKAELVRRTAFDVSLLPLNNTVTQLMSEARDQGRPLVLATASDQNWAEKIADEFGPFELVLGSTPGHNLKGHRKAEALVGEFGEQGFDYVGNDSSDIVCFAKAHTGFLVEPSASLLRRSLLANKQVHSLGMRKMPWGAVIRSLRPYQWVKNLLIFVPALAAQVLWFDNALPLITAFVVFSAMASAVYITNDLLDVQSDRVHPSKKRRPFAAGELSIPVGIVTSTVLVVASLLGSWLFLGTIFSVVLATYAVSTFAYSMWLKRVVLVDVFVLAGLYGLRLIAGAVAFSLAISPWLAAFSTFAFLSLALLKRFAEMSEKHQTPKFMLPGRGYRSSDSQPIALFGVASGFVGGVVLALYLEDPNTSDMYSAPLFLWTIVALWLFWIARAWLFAFRGQMKDDPVLFAVKDKGSYLAGLAIVLAFILAR
jgi:4-hydroxybenzoate polyprenyltransferase/phosphoserine phosphatase